MNIKLNTGQFFQELFHLKTSRPFTIPSQIAKQIFYCVCKVVGRKISKGGGVTEKTEKVAKKSTNKPISTIFVQCMKIQGVHKPLADVHVCAHFAVNYFPVRITK